MSRTIKLLNSDVVVLVDEEDYAELSQYRWYMDAGYAAANIYLNFPQTHS